MKLPIPDDWNEDDDGWLLFAMCVPNSKQWRAIIRGRISDITGGRAWDERTGHIKTVQALAWQIYNSIMACKLDELVNEFKRLNAIMAGETLAIVDANGDRHEYDYSDIGMQTRLHQIDQTLAGLKTAVAELQPADNEALVDKLEEIRVVIETRSIADTTAANTRGYKMVEALKSIDAGVVVNLNNALLCGGSGSAGSSGAAASSDSGQITITNDGVDITGELPATTD